MEKQHLTYFKIENFKRFDSFEMSNLGQFNLIVGDNNVGKTSVLEGLCFDNEPSKFLSNFYSTLTRRNGSLFRVLTINNDYSRFDLVRRQLLNDVNKQLSLQYTLYGAPKIANLKVSFLSESEFTIKDIDYIKNLPLVDGTNKGIWGKFTFNKKYLGVTPLTVDLKVQLQGVHICLLYR